MDKSGFYISAENAAQTKAPKVPREIWMLLALILFIAMWLGVASFMSRDGLDSSSWALMTGIVLLAIFLAVGTLMISRNKSDAQSNLPIEALFSEHKMPLIITQGERPFAANKAYLSLFGLAQFNDSLQTQVIPPLEDLIEDASGDMAKSLYRLHNLREDTASETTSFYRKGEGEKLIGFDLRVSGLGQAKLWEILETPQINDNSPLFDAAPIGLLSVSEDGKIIGMNQALSAWVGEDLSHTEALSDVFQDADIFSAAPPKDGRKIRAETRLNTPEGTQIPVVVSANWVKLPDGRLIAITAVHGHSNISTAYPTSSASEGLSTSAPLPGLNDASSPMAAIEIDRANFNGAKLIRANQAFKALLGQEVKAGAIISELISVESNVDVTKPIETKLANAAGTPVSVYVAANHALNGGAWVYFVDISNLRSLETQLSQSQKMQAIGQLAAGVAHDFNNLLQAIRLNADELLGRHPVGDPSYPELQKINSTVTRSAALVTKLLAFSRQQTLRPVVLNLGETLADIMIVLRQVMVERVKLDIVHGRGVPDILADKSQLETVLMNLCVNARDAMAERGGGQITIESAILDRKSIKDPVLQQSLIEFPTDVIATISVTDTGTGIPAEILEKIFEPFFTTKEQGKGTGLGLATVYGIVQQSGGHLTVDSRLGVGTTFRLFFPEVDAEKARAAAEAAAQKPAVKENRAPTDLAGQGNILFVEDEDNVRIIAAKTLRKRGYNVLEACDGEEALEILDETDTPFDLLISDVVMPGVDGPTLLKKGKEKLGDARIVFISGYAEEDFSDLLAEHPDVSFLPKPFTLTQLAEKVKQQIGEAIV